MRVSHYANTAYRILKRQAPHVGVIVSGWGGDRWMRFSDFYEGLDKTLPPDVVFAALDNIDPAAEPNVSAVYGKLSPQRQRWPIPWWESDGGGLRRDQWGPQCNTRPFVALARDTLGQALPRHAGHPLAYSRRGGSGRVSSPLCLEPGADLRAVLRRFRPPLLRSDRGPATMSAVHQQLESLGSALDGGSRADGVRHVRVV